MLLRRVIEHVREQNWTAVVLDFAIVVVGVFIGLQVSNWNADRAQAAREATMLEAVGEELGAFVEGARALVRERAWFASNFALVVEAIDEGEVPEDRAAFEFGLHSISYGRPPPATGGVLDELAETGALSRLSDAGLRREISRYLAKRDAVHENVLRVNRLLSDISASAEVPFVADVPSATAVRALVAIDAPITLEQLEPLRQASGELVGVRSFDLEAMRSDPAVRSAYVKAFDANMAALRWLLDLSSDSERLRKRLLARAGRAASTPAAADASRRGGREP